MSKSGGASLAATLAATLGSVSNLDIGQSREQLPIYDIDQIDADDRNFYNLSDIDELAANILLVGLQQPIRVRRSETDPARVVIVSGHRRHAALRKLVDEGNDAFRKVPCILEQDAVSPAMQELRLIYANAGTRVLSSPEVSHQAERVERLLYDLKEEGFEFPGKMRDHVAEACKVSASKLARLKVIREALVPELKTGFESKKLNESVAYALAKQSPDVQRVILQYRKKKEMQFWSEWSATQDAEKVSKIISRKCKKCGGICENQKAMLDKVFSDGYGYRPCDRHCCEKCDLLTSCKSACPLLAEKIKKLKADTREQNRQNKLEKEAKEAPVLKKIQTLWIRFGYAREQAHKSVKEAFEVIGRYYNKEYEKDWLEQENATAKFTTSTTLPYSYNFSLEHAKSLCAAADLFGCTTDFLLCRTDDLKGPPAPSSSGEWRTDNNYPPDKYLTVLFYLPGAPRLIREKAYVWNGELYANESLNRTIDMEPIAWCVQPDLPPDLLPPSEQYDDNMEDAEDD